MSSSSSSSSYVNTRHHHHHHRSSRSDDDSWDKRSRDTLSQTTRSDDKRTRSGGTMWSRSSPTRRRSSRQRQRQRRRYDYDDDDHNTGSYRSSRETNTSSSRRRSSRRDENITSMRTTMATSTVSLSSDNDHDDHVAAHKAAVANAAAVAIAAAQNVAKTQEKHELERRIAVARATTTKGSNNRRTAAAAVLPGFASMNDEDEDDDEDNRGALPPSSIEGNGHHSGEESTTTTTMILSSSSTSTTTTLPIHTTKTKQMDDFLDEIKSRHQLRHEVEVIKDTLKKGTLTVAEELRNKERLSTLQSLLGGITTLQESEMIGKAMRGEHSGDVDYYDDDEQETANLYIGNLPFGVTEDMLIKEYGIYGSITSVKIMYPRTDEERSRGYVPAFIAFSSRDEAQAAKDAMESGPCTFGGAMMRETVLRVGWGKAMNSAQVKTAQRNKNMLVQVAQQQEQQGEQGERTAIQGSTGSTLSSSHLLLPSSSPTSSSSSTTILASSLHCSSNFSQPKPSRHIHVEIPKSDTHRSLIDKIARMVADNGRNVEQVAIMRVQARNGRKEKYNFLFDYDSPDGQYYRWRTFAYAQGDSGSRWRTEPFIMCQANPLSNDPTVLWHPPACKALEKRASSSSTQQHHHHHNSHQPYGTTNESDDMLKRGPGGRSRTKIGGKALLPSDKALFMDMLHNLNNTRRDSIKEIMVWCIDHTDSSIEIVDIIVDEIVRDSNDVDNNKEEEKDDDRSTGSMIKQIALLYLISDILHNSGCSTKNGAWSYRTQIEGKCALIMATFGKRWRMRMRNRNRNKSFVNGDASSSSTTTAAAAASASELSLSSTLELEKCCNVLNAWEQNAIFAPEYLKGLEATLMRVPDDDDDDVGDNDKIELYTTEEERTRHFSQLERYCRNNGLLWEYPHTITDAEDKRQWLLMQIVNERVYHKKSITSIDAGAQDDGIDGESVGSDDISIASSSLDYDEDDDIDGEALLILPGDGIEYDDHYNNNNNNNNNNNKKKQQQQQHDDDDESLDGSPL